MEFVDFNLAKKLKEKGFPQHITNEAYITDNYGENEIEIQLGYDIGDRLPIPLIPDYMDDVASPTISQVLKWLREEEGLHICISLGEFSDWDYEIALIDGNILCAVCEDSYPSYELAAIAGIEYCLDNLI